MDATTVESRATGIRPIGSRCRQSWSGSMIYYQKGAKAYWMRQARVKTRKAVQNRQTDPTRSRHESRTQIIGYRNSFRYCAGSGLVSWMQRHEVHGNADKLAEYWWKLTGICTTRLMREKCMGTGEEMGVEDQVGPEWKGVTAGQMREGGKVWGHLVDGRRMALTERKYIGVDEERGRDREEVSYEKYNICATMGL